MIKKNEFTLCIKISKQSFKFADINAKKRF